MQRESGSLKLTLARAGAVVLALGALAYFVVNAQLEAQPAAPPASDSTGDDSTGDELPYEESSGTSPALSDEPIFMPSTKSAIGVGTDHRREAIRKPGKKKPVFLPSSKSMPIEAPSKPEPETNR